MRSLTVFHTSLSATCAACLSGCLVSEEPILDASNGHATPLRPGAYTICPVEETEDDCTVFDVDHDVTGLYRFTPPEEAPSEMRFRRISRMGYAVQSAEDDGYAYYYGRGDTREFRLTMMMCADLPEGLRSRLIENGDLETEDGDVEVCTVKSRRGLTDAAKAYHRGDVSDEEEAAIIFTPAPER